MLLTIASDEFLAGFAVALLTAAGAGLVLRVRGSLALDSVARVLERLAGGDFDARVRDAPGGLGDLAAAVNRMAGSVQQRMAAAAQERARLIAALNSSADAVLALDPETNILFANTAAEVLFGRSAAQIIGQPLVWVLPNEQVLQAVQATRDSDERRVNFFERPRRRHLQVVTTRILGGGDWLVLAVIHDLTDIRRTEQMRRDFVANVSHELRTPLAGINSVIETLAAGAIDDRPAALDFLRRADEEVDRLIELVEELLELSRIESGEVPLAPRPTDIAELLGAAVERMRPQAQRKHQTLTLEAEHEVVDVDRSRIERAVLNLLHNAIKFTPEGGSVSVTAATQDDSLTVNVSDTGIGIEAAEQPRVFERFYKTDQSRAGVGSGLGLALVKHAVESHAGRVRVESQPGRGSTFSFTIPRHQTGPKTEVGPAAPYRGRPGI